MAEISVEAGGSDAARTVETIATLARTCRESLTDTALERRMKRHHTRFADHTTNPGKYSPQKPLGPALDGTGPNSSPSGLQHQPAARKSFLPRK